MDLLADFQASGASTLGVTVMRTHLRVQLPYVNVSDQWSIGLIVARAQDIGIGTANGPDPGVNPDLNWAYNDRIWAISNGSAIDVAREITIDIRAKRKVQELNERFVFAIRNATAASAQCRVFARTLVALP